MGFVNEPENQRAVDYERDIVLTSTGGNRENILNFDLHINEKKMTFSAVYRLGKLIGENRQIQWCLFDVYDSDGGVSNDEETVKIIKEALACYGIRHWNKNLSQPEFLDGTVKL